MKQLTTLIIAAMLSLPAVSCEEGEVIEEIGGESITTTEFEKFYEAAIESMAVGTSADKETIYKVMCDPMLPNHERLRGLHPQAVYSEYRRMIMIEQVAREDGFLERPMTKMFIEQSRLATIQRLYLQEQFNRKVRISEEAVLEHCQELRATEPRVAALPLDQCKILAKGSLKGREFELRQGEIRDEILERVQVRQNEDFDKEDFLKNGMEIYQEIKREGGCDLTDSGLGDMPELDTPGLIQPQ